MRKITGILLLIDSLVFVRCSIEAFRSSKYRVLLKTPCVHFRKMTVSFLEYGYLMLAIACETKIHSSSVRNIKRSDKCVISRRDPKEAFETIL